MPFYLPPPVRKRASPSPKGGPGYAPRRNVCLMKKTLPMKTLKRSKFRERDISSIANSAHGQLTRNTWDQKTQLQRRSWGHLWSTCATEHTHYTYLRLGRPNTHLFGDALKKWDLHVRWIGQPWLCFPRLLEECPGMNIVQFVQGNGTSKMCSFNS